MAYPLELDITFSSAKDLKNVNWRNGDLKPYVVAWIDPSSKLTTRADEEGDTSPAWNEKLTIPLRGAPLDDAVLHIDVVHAGSSGDTKPLVGSAKLPLKDIVDEVGFSEPYETTLKLKRPSGRPQGKLIVRATVREMRYPAPGAYAPPYGQATRDYQPPAGYPYAAPYGAPPAPYGAPPAPYGAPPAPYGYPCAYGSGYGAAPPQPQYYGGGYDSGYGSAPTASAPSKGSKYGVGTGLAVGAVAGVLGGLALAEGVDYVEDKIAEEAAEKVEGDLGYGDDF
ncbi:probable calcium-binding protein CML50 [Nymphaea colorata]|uniref:C2 domain-containing protein n=1 Tax=Nymphaea colorata TaxID=210225 RepID=A0A5K0Y9U6_9MAGN|nr:probable calcium-binding protein CML50 [Nymphaea colorata]VVV73744.1 unnamed protein product [Nymphaea colorata]